MSTQAEHSANFQHNLSDAISLLPKLTTGIDINVRFDGIRRVEYTREITVFDILGIDLVHGWLIDPQDISTAKAIGSRSYNELVVCVIQALGENATPKVLSRRASRAVHEQQQQQKTPFVDQAALAAALQSIGVGMTEVLDNQGGSSESTQKAEASKDTDADQRQSPPKGDALPLHDILLVQDFLETHSSQLTVFGLTSLQEDLADGSLAVFFRNNHFNVILRSGTGLYLLVTDEGYRFESDVVWEHLNNVDGDTQLVGWDLCPFAPHAIEEPPKGNSAMVVAHEDADFALAMQLQQEEEARVRRMETTTHSRVQGAEADLQQGTSLRSANTSGMPGTAQQTTGERNETARPHAATAPENKPKNKRNTDCALM